MCGKHVPLTHFEKTKVFFTDLNIPYDEWTERPPFSITIPGTGRGMTVIFYFKDDGSYLETLAYGE